MTDELLAGASTVNGQNSGLPYALLALGSMSANELPDTPEDFAGRLALAIELKKITRSRTERESGLKRGRIQRLLGIGPKQIAAPGPETIRQLADYLGVSYEWLAIGRGPLRREGWAPSALEEATLFARSHGAREDAIRAATERYRDEPDMDVWSWILAIDGEARRLERLNVPRPEVIAKGQARVRRIQSKKKRRAQQESEELAAAASRARRGA